MSPPRLSAVFRIFSTLSLSLCAALPGANAQQNPEIKVVRIATGPTDSTAFPFGGLIGNAISNPPGSRPCDRGGSCGVPGLIATAQTTGGTLDNLRAVARGDIELGLSDADIAEWVHRGSYEFEGQEPLTRLRLIAQIYPATLHLIARKDAKIKSVRDLAGKKVAVDGEGAGTRYTARVVLSAFDVPWDAVSMKALDLTAAPAAFQAGEVDAMFVIGGAPVLALADLARALPFDLVPIDGPAAEKIAQVMPYYSLDQVPADAYAGIPATPTIAVGAVLVARDDLNDDLAFGIARAIWHERNAPLFAAGHPRGKLMDQKRAVDGLRLPVHPGAARFYIAKGLMDPLPEPPAAETPVPETEQPAAKPAAPARAASATP